MTSSKSFKVILSKVSFKTNIGKRINTDNPATKIGSYSYLYNNGAIADDNWEFYALDIIDEYGIILASNKYSELNDKSVRYFIAALNEGLEVEEVVMEVKDGLVVFDNDFKFYLKQNLIEHSCETINELKRTLEQIKNKTNDSEIIELVNSTFIYSEKIRTINRDLRYRIKELKSKIC